MKFQSIQHPIDFGFQSVVGRQAVVKHFSLKSIIGRVQISDFVVSGSVEVLVFVFGLIRIGEGFSFVVRVVKKIGQRLRRGDLAIDFKFWDVPIMFGVGFDEIVKLSNSIPNLFWRIFFRIGVAKQVLLFRDPAVKQIMERAVTLLKRDIVGLTEPVHHDRR